VPGNHDYLTAFAAGYFGYFGSRAGEQDKGYYSFDLGGWHIIALNSNIGMSESSAQVTWLKADLAASTKRCTLAMWHHPRFSSGRHGSWGSPGPLWDALYAAGAEIVLVGHDHLYERFAPQTPSAAADPQYGIRQFVVGTGGSSNYDFVSVAPNSEVRANNNPGVLKLVLKADSYTWQFIPVAGKTFTDSGEGNCHGVNPNPPPAPATAHLLTAATSAACSRGELKRPIDSGSTSCATAACGRGAPRRRQHRRLHGQRRRRHGGTARRRARHGTDPWGQCVPRRHDRRLQQLLRTHLGPA
jgi:3',5'-cyclic AMP phosphodiesterase CpdA